MGSVEYSPLATSSLNSCDINELVAETTHSLETHMQSSEITGRCRIRKLSYPTSLTIRVHCIIISIDGSIHDVLSLGVRVALGNIKIPEERSLQTKTYHKYNFLNYSQ